MRSTSTRSMEPATPAAVGRAGPQQRSRVRRAIAWGGLVAGTLDIADALGFQWAMGRDPVRVLHSIASGVLGREAAYSGGAPAAALGLLLHYVIAVTAAAVYVVASLRIPVLVRRAIVCGMAYGLVVQAVMHFVVLPLAGLRGGLPTGLPLANLVLAHLFCVGLPIGLAAGRALGDR
jgi:hypothetical protein